MLSLMGSDGLSGYVQVVIEYYIWFLSFIFLFLSNSCMFSVAVYCFGQVVGSNPKRERYARLWVHAPLMTRLSDRNMSLGDVLLPQRGNNDACNRGCKDCLLYAKCFLMQLSVALGLHFGWGSQLNTSEMFWIDISRWMISSRCSWISVYLFLRTAHAFEPRPFFVA